MLCLVGECAHPRIWDLTQLLHRYLSSNQITLLPVGVFDDLTSLQYLWVTPTCSRCLRDVVSDGCMCISILPSQACIYIMWSMMVHCLQCVIKIILSLSLHNLGFGIWHRNLYNNRITSLPVGLFDRLKSLKYMWVMACVLLAGVQVLCLVGACA